MKNKKPKFMIAKGFTKDPKPIKHGRFAEVKTKEPLNKVIMPIPSKEKYEGKVCIKIDPTIKEKAKKMFQKYGLTQSGVVREIYSLAASDFFRFHAILLKDNENPKLNVFQSMWNWIKDINKPKGTKE